MAARKAGRLDLVMRVVGLGVDGLGIALALLIGYLLGVWR